METINDHRHTALILLLLMIFRAIKYSLALRKGTSTQYRRSTEKRTIFNSALREGGSGEDCHRRSDLSIESL